jgi:glycosyltransferase involved in cell wall biosynthesis
MALEWYLSFPLADLIVYDCMDELSLFKNAPGTLVEREKCLLQTADLVFTGGVSLYEAKKKSHPSVFAFPSSIDKDHFGKAREIKTDAAEQAQIPHPRIGFFGVIDERFDINLLQQIASLRPDWHFIIIGPVVKIDPATLPANNNIHYLGNKHYRELPEYLAGWDVAMIPFALNESTRFISPTKTPEYLAGGKPVVSTPITDVVKLYGQTGLIYIADNAPDFIEQTEKALAIKDNPAWHKAVDNFLSTISWDMTWEKMMFQINTRLESKKMNKNKSEEYV